MDGVVDEDVVELEVSQHVLEVLLEHAHEVEEVVGGVEAGPEGLVRVLHADDHRQGQRLPVVHVEVNLVDGDDPGGGGGRVAAVSHQALGDGSIANGALSVQSHLGVSHLRLDVRVRGLSSNSGLGNCICGISAIINRF